jgi:hypothetical protein
MKLAPEVIAELIDAFIEGITEQKDISDRIRSIDLVENNDSNLIDFSDEWKSKKSQSPVSE